MRTGAAVRQRLRRVPSASPRLRALVGCVALAVSIWLIARVDAVGVGQGRALAFVGGLALVAVVLAATTLPQAASAAAILLLLLPLPALATERTRDVAVELAVLAVLAVELTAWAADLRSLVRETRESIVHRATHIAAAVVGTAGVSTVALAAADLGGPHGRAALLLGLAAVGAAVGILVGVLAHRARITHAAQTSTPSTGRTLRGGGLGPGAT